VTVAGRRQLLSIWLTLLGAPAAFDASHVPAQPGPGRTSFGRWFDTRQTVLHVLAVSALVWQGIYLAWRIGWSWHGADPLLWTLMLLVDVYGLCSLATLAWFSWRIDEPVRPAAGTRQPEEPDRVDVYVCTYDESPEVVRATLLGCAALSYPHRTYLLDDGRRHRMKTLADELGATWITRTDNSDAKAGNINHALHLTDGDLVFLLDADHVPLPDALDALIGYFQDERLALVQTPHDFYNHDSVQHYEVGRHEQSVFFEVVCPGKDRHGAAFWCGSATLVRRAALLDVGGVATETIAEDFHTTIKMHERGWTTRYHAEILVQGLGPHDLDGYLLQRDRWARGNLSVLHTPQSPLRASSLSPRQRLSYAASLLGYGAGPARAVLLAVLATCLWTGRLPLAASVPALALLWAPATGLTLLAGSALCRGHTRLKDSVHFELLSAQIYLRALRCVVVPSRATFKVTPKAGTDAGGWHTLARLPLIVGLTVALAAGLVLRGLYAMHAPGAGWLPPLSPVAAVVVPGFAVIELRRLLRTLALVVRRRQRRAEFRFGCNEPAALLSPSIGVTQEAVVRGASTSGLGIDLTAPVPIGETVVVWLALPRPDGEPTVIRVHATVRSCRPGQPGTWRVGLALNGGPTAAPRALWEFCYLVCPTRRLRSTPNTIAVRRQTLAALERLRRSTPSPPSPSVLGPSLPGPSVPGPRIPAQRGPLPAVDPSALPRPADRRVFSGAAARTAPPADPR
jgi:cellulose synthase (UDP-forming)